MKLQAETYKIQENLGTYCKTGSKTEIPGLTENRVHHYRRLVYNAVKNTMEQAFPICSQVLNEEAYDSLVHRFLSEYNCQTPQIWKLPGEFYQWVVSSGLAQELKLPWLNDLLLFEWIEIDVHTMEDIAMPEAYKITDLFKNYLVFNPEFKLIRLEYPVHLFNIKDVSEKKAEYFILISRDPESGKVYFFNLSVLHVWVLEQMMNNPLCLEDLIPEIHKNFGIESETVLKNNFREIFNELIQKKFILGSSS